MARRRKSRRFGSTAAVHLNKAARSLNQARFEEKVVRGHLARGECTAAITGLAYVGYQTGKAVANKEGTGAKRGGRGRMTTSRFHKLSKAVAAKCVR